MIPLLVIFSLLTFSLADDPHIVAHLTTPSGSTASITGYAHPYGNSWRGIPYAQAPLGSLRFTNAQRRDPTSNMTALGYGNSCVQSSGGSENCLFLNVFTSVNTSFTDKLPVYVWIHGGGFVEGSGNMGAGIYPDITNKGVVLVSINYRLGPYGFFSTRDAMAPGNFAVSDWIEALYWVQRYISFFGGDPKRVTVGGQSSGGEAVSLLSFTPKANGLYSKLIIQSGSAFGAAVFSYSEKTRDTSRQLSVATGCSTADDWNTGSNFGSILNCLRGLTMDSINKADNKLPNHRMKWSAVADKTYFPQRLETIALKRLSVPILIGDVHDEWLAWEEYNIEHNLNSSSNTQNGLRNDLKNSYEMSYWDNPTSDFVAASNNYINNQIIEANDHVGWMAQRIKLYSEMVFIGPVLRDARYFDYTRSDVYLYSFDYLSPLALPLITDPILRGVPHAWEIRYEFDTSCDGYSCQSDDNKVRNYLTTMWTDFIKFGKPTPSNSSIPISWPKIGSADAYISLKPSLSSSLDFHPDSKFWACTAPTIDGYKPPFC